MKLSRGLNPWIIKLHAFVKTNIVFGRVLILVLMDNQVTMLNDYWATNTSVLILVLMDNQVTCCFAHVYHQGNLS